MNPLVKVTLVTFENNFQVLKPLGFILSKSQLFDTLLSLKLVISNARNESSYFIICKDQLVCTSLAPVMGKEWDRHIDIG